MSLSNLTAYTQADYNALSKASLSPGPQINTTNTPDSRISVALDGWISGRIMAIRITSAANTSASLSISNSTNNETTIEVSTGTNPNNVETYWTVDMGQGAGASDWSISFNTSSGGRTTGKWTFTRGKQQRPR